MMNTVSERRRNMRAESCRACGVLCDPGQGYLYHDTQGRYRNARGRFGWFVKCAKCHAGSKTKMTVRMEKAAVARANEPVIRPWSISQAKKWAVNRIVDAEGDAAIEIDAGSFREIVSFRDPINSQFNAPMGYALEQHAIAGKPLSFNAAVNLTARIELIVNAVRAEEAAGVELALAKLIAAGATGINNRHGLPHYRQFEFDGGKYHVWGQPQGGNKITGIGKGSGWVETTAEKLLEANQDAPEA